MENNYKTTIIKLSRKKIFLYLTFASIFIVISIFLILKSTYFINPLIHNWRLIKCIGGIGLLLFGFMAILLLIKIFDKKNGLVISHDGIYDNSATSAVGLIEWDDIVAINILDQETAKGVIINVENQSKYLARVKNKLVKYNMKAVAKWYSSPFIITATNLQITNDELQKIIIQNFELYKNNKS